MLGSTEAHRNNRQRLQFLRTSTALGGIFAVGALAMPQAAHAQDCGAPVNGVVTCTAAGNPYNNGVTYVPADDLTVITNTDTVINNTVSVTGANGVHITNNGSITSTGNSTSSTTAGPPAIFASGTTRVIVDGRGGITARGTNARAIDARATGTGTIKIDVGDVTTTGTGGQPNNYGLGSRVTEPNSSAITAISEGGTINISARTINVSGDGASGVEVYSSGGSGDISISTGAITGTGNNVGGIYVATGFSSSGNATIDVAGPINVSGDFASGISVSMFGNQGKMVTIHTGNITVSNNSSFLGSGIFLETEGGANVTFDTVIANNVGVSVNADDLSGSVNDVTVSGVNASTTSENGVGVLGATFGGNATVTVTGLVSAAGDSSIGVLGAADNGSATVSVNNVSASAVGVIASADRDARVTISGAVRVSGISAYADDYTGERVDGVYVSSEHAIASVTNNGSVTVAGDGAHGILAKSNGSVILTGAGSVSTSGTGSDAILARASGAVSVTGGNVSTTGNSSRGVVASSTIIQPVPARGEIVTGPDGFPMIPNPTGVSGPVAVDIGAVTTTGTNASGIVASSDTGAVSVTARSVAVAGSGSIGIAASGSAAVTVSTGTISARDAAAVSAVSSGGPVAVTLNGATSTGTGSSVRIDAATTAVLNLGAGGTLTSPGGGARLTSTTGATVNNGGTITGTGGAAIVTAIGGPLSFTNTNSFTGVIGFTGGNDAVANSGTYVASFNQEFGAGNDSFSNTGTLAVLRGAPGAATVNFTGLETFNNSGLTDLRNGHAGDVLSLSSNFGGTGGSTLAIDFGSGSGASDKLVVAGAITGSTALVIGNNAAVIGSSKVFATGGAGSSPTAFTLATQLQSTGFLSYGIVFDPTAITYAVDGSPSDAVFRTLKINEGAQQLWYKTAEAFSAHVADLRDAAFAGAAPGGGRIWGQMFGEANTRNGAEPAGAFGQARTIDLSYKQDAFGGQIGADLGGSGRLVVGVTGGYASSVLGFRNSADRATYDTVDVGLYASFSSAGLFANVLGKYDYSWVRSYSQLAGYTARFNGQSYGAQAEAGFRFGSPRLYAEPVGTIAYVRTDLKDLNALGATIDFDRLDGLRGKAGLRVGGRFKLGAATTGTLYAQGNYVHEFKGRNGITFIAGTTSLAFRNRPLGDYGEGKIGFNIVTAGGVSGFVEGFGDYSDQYRGGGGRAGIRIKF